MAKKDKAIQKIMADKKKKKGMSLKARLVFIVGLFLSLLFLPTSMLLFVGLLPSVAAFLIGKRVSTIVAMNLAGCIPFVFKLWSSENDFDTSVQIFSNPNYLVVMYMAAAFGYLIEWVVTGIVASFLYQKGINRMKDIRKRQEVLIEQWGQEVSGKISSDDHT